MKISKYRHNKYIDRRILGGYIIDNIPYPIYINEFGELQRFLFLAYSNLP